MHRSAFYIEELVGRDLAKKGRKSFAEGLMMKMGGEEG